MQHFWVTIINLAYGIKKLIKFLIKNIKKIKLRRFKKTKRKKIA